MVEYNKGSKPQYDLILGTKTMKELGIVLDFKAKMLTIDEIILPMRNINHLQSASTLCVLKLNHSLVVEPQSTQEATKHATQILEAKYNKADLLSIIKEICKHLSANQQKKLLQLLKKYELLFLRHFRWLEDWAGILLIEGRRVTISRPSFPSTKNT